MARMMRAIRSGAAGAAMVLWAGAAIAAPVPQDAQQVSPDDREAPEDYGWIDRADALWDAIGDAPPDYSFAFDDGESRGEPWAWETADGYWIVVEDTPEGMRSYYFEPNAEGPFLAREADYSFGYDDGEIAMVYDAGGGALPRAEGAAHFDEGEALYDRGVALRRAVRQRNWQPVDTTAWVDVSLVLIGLQNQWDEGRRRHPGWRRHRDLPNVIAWHNRWDSEHRRRADASERFRRWREGGYQGKPPGRPGGWAHGPHGPGRADGQPGRPGGRPHRPAVPITGPDSGPIAAARPANDVPRETGERPVRGPLPRGKLSDGPAEAVTGAPPTRPGRGKWRGGDGRPGRDRGDGAQPVAAAPTPVVAPAAPATRPVPVPRPAFRPRPSTDAQGAGFQRPPRPAFTPRERPVSAAPAAASPQRPAYTPPPQQRPASAPAPRPPAPRSAPPPRPAKLDRGDTDKP
ncbi:hypothetical protein IAG41_13970 [Sphingomonas sp. JC676]|uniref:hypothetical protein n=1 Tax=Sphingomonas sp. JC676 TaxID=2768065 RepID=UPI0016583750|nr:hypothetical protein [Sphingomonas sp. JC676]MBC9033499.1 hypothetical protein [Sphingomonas sp. JC676]